MRRLAFALLLVSGTAGTARADGDALRLTWRAPPGCPSSEEVRSATLRGVGADHAAKTTLEADATVDDSSGAWRVKLRTRRGAQRGEREIEASSCRGVADATSVVLALALVPSAEPEADLPVNVAAPQHAHPLVFGLGIAADPSTLPKAAVGAAVMLAWTPGRWRIEAQGRRWAAISGTVPAADAGARFAMTSVGGRGCWAATDRTIAVGPCAGVDANVVSAQGFGARANYDRSATWAALSGGVLVRAKLTPWLALRAGAEALVPFTRPTFVVEGEGTVHRPPAVGAAGTFGAEISVF